MGSAISAFGASALIVLVTACSSSSGSTNTSKADSGAPLAPLDSGTISLAPPTDSGATLLPQDGAASTPDGGAVACVPPESQSPTCTQCMTQNCCSTFVACDSDTACVALQKCIDDCYKTSQGQQQFDACVQTCVQQSTQQAVQMYDAADQCIRQSCGNVCQPN